MWVYVHLNVRITWAMCEQIIYISSEINLSMGINIWQLIYKRGQTVIYIRNIFRHKYQQSCLHSQSRCASTTPRTEPWKDQQTYYRNTTSDGPHVNDPSHSDAIHHQQTFPHNFSASSFVNGGRCFFGSSSLLSSLSPFVWPWRKRCMITRRNRLKKCFKVSQQRPHLHGLLRISTW